MLEPDGFPKKHFQAVLFLVTTLATSTSRKKFTVTHHHCHHGSLKTRIPFLCPYSFYILMLFKCGHKKRFHAELPSPSSSSCATNHLHRKCSCMRTLLVSNVLFIQQSNLKKNISLFRFSSPDYFFLRRFP